MKDEIDEIEYLSLRPAGREHKQWPADGIGAVQRSLVGGLYIIDG